jgi:hypothetical protein
MGNQVDEQILRLYLDVKEPSNKILPDLTSQFPFLNLALHTLKERRNDFQSGERKIWKQLRELMRDIKWTIDDPKPIDLTQAFYTLQCLTHLVESQTTPPTPIISKKSKTILKETKEIFLTYTRRILTFQLGQYLSLRTLEEYVPSPPAAFLGFVKREDIANQDESGDYHEFLLNQIEFMFDFLHETFDTFQKIFLENTQTLIQFLKKLHKIQSINNFQPELIRLQYRLDNFPRINWPCDREEVDDNKTLLAKTKRDLQIVLDFLQAPPPPRPSQISRQAATPCHAHSQTRRAQRYRQPRRHLPDDRAREGPSHFQSFRQSTPLRQVHYPAVEDDTRHNLRHINERFNHVVRF